MLCMIFYIDFSSMVANLNEKIYLDEGQNEHFFETCFSRGEWKFFGDVFVCVFEDKRKCLIIH